jgi:hypothetical protein
MKRLHPSKKKRINGRKAIEAIKRIIPFVGSVQYNYIPIEKVMQLPRGQYVYILQDISMTGYFKIGKTTNPHNRIDRFDVKLPFDVGVVALLRVNDCSKEESRLHKIHAKDRKNGEWFELGKGALLGLLASKRAITYRNIDQILTGNRSGDRG